MGKRRKVTAVKSTFSALWRLNASSYCSFSPCRPPPDIIGMGSAMKLVLLGPTRALVLAKTKNAKPIKLQYYNRLKAFVGLEDDFTHPFARSHFATPPVKWVWPRAFRQSLWRHGTVKRSPLARRTRVDRRAPKLSRLLALGSGS